MKESCISAEANQKQRFHFKTRKQELNSIEGSMFTISNLVQEQEADLFQAQEQT